MYISQTAKFGQPVDRLHVHLECLLLDVHWRFHFGSLDMSSLIHISASTGCLNINIGKIYFVCASLLTFWVDLDPWQFGVLQLIKIHKHPCSWRDSIPRPLSGWHNTLNNTASWSAWMPQVGSLYGIQFWKYFGVYWVSHFAYLFVDIQFCGSFRRSFRVPKLEYPVLDVHWDVNSTFHWIFVRPVLCG